MNKKERVKDLEGQISKLNKIVLGLKEEQDLLYKSIFDDKAKKLSNPEEIFMAWCDSKADKTDYSNKEHFRTSSNKDLNNYFEFNRYQVVELEWFQDSLSYWLEKARENDGIYETGYGSYKKPITEQDILDWMKALMDADFGSMTYDW